MPVVAAESKLAEITLKALLLGLVLSALLASANAYTGLLVGLTISASIPAAAVSMGVLRLFRLSNILENNMVQTTNVWYQNESDSLPEQSATRHSSSATHRV